MKKIISAILIFFILPASSCLAVENKTIHFIFGVSDLYSPVLSDEENRSVLESLTKGATVTATYRHTTRKFHWFSTMSGVTTFLDPGYKYTSKDETRSYTLLPEADNRSILGVDMPVSLDGDYVLAELYVQLYPSLYQQPGYLATIKNLPEKDLKFSREFRGSSSFRYLVSQDKRRTQSPVNEHQGCLFVTTPYGYPDTTIPVVTLVGTNLTNMRLTNIMHQRCPLVNINTNEKSTVLTGHLPPARIAAAQANIDYSTTKGITQKSGALHPVNKEMARWYQRNDEGVYAALQAFGPFKLFRMRIRFDAAYPEGKRLPIRTESWYLYNEKLVKYSGSIYYLSTDNEKSMSADEVVYFHDEKKVFNESKKDNCNTQGCQNALADIKHHSTNSWDDLQREAVRYMQLTLIPITDDE
ncbi:hypothetical protein JK231_01115 [Pantoea sp. JGM49]|uniref:hypothetical protein n=1 Tax=Pantoea sp. JGM49 TaxID=2799791 RepID=UPI001BA56C5C|nr:hypothetical protein [Pantoea sp. JGM49]MBS0879202.1 hypothetical protein [Pantoea sp. JGM49]